jgi:hypothetical protein
MLGVDRNAAFVASDSTSCNPNYNHRCSNNNIVHINGKPYLHHCCNRAGGVPVLIEIAIFSSAVEEDLELWGYSSFKILFHKYLARKTELPPSLAILAIFAIRSDHVGG